MRNLILVILVGLAAYGGYTIWSKHHDTAQQSPVGGPDVPAAETGTEAPAPANATSLPPVVATETDVPAQPVAASERLAPPGVYYVVHAFSTVTDEGVKGVRPGAKVTLVKDAGTTLRVTDGQQEFDVRRECVTNDLDLAARVYSAQKAQSAALADVTARKEQSAATAQQQSETDARMAVDAAKRNAALNALQTRENYLNAEAAKIESLITGYQNADSHLRMKQYWINERIAGNTHIGEIAELRKQLATIRGELNGIATKKFQVGH